MLSICKAVDYIGRQILASSLPNKIAGYLFRNWNVKEKLNLLQFKFYLLIANSSSDNCRWKGG